MLTEMLEAALPGRWTVIKRRHRSNVYPSPQPGFEVSPPEFFRFREEFRREAFRNGTAVPGRWGHALLFPDADAVQRLAEDITLAVEPCPEECDCRKRNAEIDRLLQS